MNDPVMSVSSSPDTPKETWGGFLLYLIVAGVIALFIRTFIAAPYIVVGQSMEPTFEQYHYLLIDKLSYRYQEPERGDVVVLDLPHNEDRALIKRIIGLPRETVVMENNAVRIITDGNPEGFLLSERYVSPQNFGGPVRERTELKENEYFVLGDNRHVSSDSRVWGVLPRHDVVGRVMLRLFPFTRIDFFPGKADY